MENLADLPLPALMTFGAVLAIVFGVRYFGLMQGLKASPSASQAQVAAVIVDPTALNRATAAVGDLTEGVVDLVREIREVRSELVIQREINAAINRRRG